MWLYNEIISASCGESSGLFLSEISAASWMTDAPLWVKLMCRLLASDLLSINSKMHAVSKSLFSVSQKVDADKFMRETFPSCTRMSRYIQNTWILLVSELWRVLPFSCACVCVCVSSQAFQQTLSRATEIASRNSLRSTTQTENTGGHILSARTDWAWPCGLSAEHHDEFIYNVQLLIHWFSFPLVLSVSG